MVIKLLIISFAWRRIKLPGLMRLDLRQAKNLLKFRPVKIRVSLSHQW
jgi:hypothetical protein